MAKKLILSDGEHAVLCKLLRANPPTQVPDLDGGELYYYRELCTHVLKEDFRFPDTDDWNNNSHTLTKECCENCSFFGGKSDIDKIIGICKKHGEIYFPRYFKCFGHKRDCDKE